MDSCLGSPMDSYWLTEPNWESHLEKLTQKVTRLGRYWAALIWWVLHLDLLMALDSCSAEYLVQKQDPMTRMDSCLGVQMDSYWPTEPNWE
eukprot:scaffold41393_cov67-Attheya_sp.AAC.1